MTSEKDGVLKVAWGHLDDSRLFGMKSAKAAPRPPKAVLPKKKPAKKKGD